MRFASLFAATALLPLGACSMQRPATIGPAPAFSSGDSAVANTQAALGRIDAVEPMVNAVIAVDPTAMEQARALDAAARRGPLHGMPIMIKDNIESKGPLPTTAGSLALANNVTNRDAPLVARLREAGAVIVGKTNLSEWANIRDDGSISGWSAVGGQTRNAHVLNRNACGSSTGSGVAVAAGMVPAAIGTETDGSITCPASLSGIVGFKPTVGLVSRTHIVPISHSQDTAGPMARTVREAALVLSAIAGSDPADPQTADADRYRADYAAGLSADSLRGKRIGVMRFASGFGTDERFEEALATLRAQGAVLVEIAKFDRKPEMGSGEYKVLLTELKADLNAYLATTPPSVTNRTLADVIAFNKANAAREMPLFDQDTFEEAELTKGLDDPEYKKARETSLRLAGAEGIDKMLKDNDVVALVGPTMPAAWLIDAVHGDSYPGGGAGGFAAVAGYPHLTVPMGAVRGLPVGLSFMGPKWSDGMILSLGYAYEQASHRKVEARFIPSVEESAEVAPLLAQQPR
ncbi:MAG TPA: amidase [Allosphingosinicella sp.]|jgi:amidase